MRYETSVVGKGIPLRGAYQKVTGKVKFAPDRTLTGALWMKLLRSPHPHARIKNIDASSTSVLPGVKAVLTYKDVPQNEIKCAILNWMGKILEERVRFVGDEVAAVAAETEREAESALDLIRVEYKQLPAVFDIEEALKPKAPDVRGFGSNKVATPPEPGVFKSLQEWGDIKKGFAEADVIVEHEIRTHSIYGTFFPPACIADWTGDELTIIISHQCPFDIRRVLSDTLEIPEHRVRIIAPFVACSFGTLNSAHRFWHLAALLSKKTGRPVIYKMTLEELGVYKRRESDILRTKIAAKKDGIITALDQEHIHDNGGYGWKSTTYATVHDIFARLSVRYTAYGVNTNKFSSGCTRGVGDVPQVIAINQAADMLSEKLGIDPLTIWRKNHYKAGDPLRSDSEPRRTLSSEAFDELIDKGAKAIEWERKWWGWGKPYEINGARRKGVGMAVALHVSGVAMTQVAATVVINHDGTADVSIGFMDLGTGCKTTFAQICAEVLGLKVEDVNVVGEVDTSTVPFAPTTGASRSLHLGGSAIKHASLDAKQQILEMACSAPWSPEILKKGVIKPQDLDIKDSFIFVKSDPNRRAAIREVVRPVIAPVIMGRANKHDIPISGPTANMTLVGFADVEADTETGKITVLKFVACHDSGRIINPEICENQVYGGVVLSLGYGLMEEVAFDPASGKALNPVLTDYRVPTSLDAPLMEVIFSENIDPVGPLGAKGIGEGPAVYPHAAIASAIYNAIGVRFNELPITPKKVLEALGRIKK